MHIVFVVVLVCSVLKFRALILESCLSSLKKTFSRFKERNRCFLAQLSMKANFQNVLQMVKIEAFKPLFFFFMKSLIKAASRAWGNGPH